MSTAIQTIKQMLPQLHQKDELGLPASVPISRFVSAVASAMLTTRDLENCSIQSIVGACRKAAIDGLLPDGREAALVVFKQKNGPPQAQYVPMVFGMLKAARRSGEILTISCHVVYEGEDFEVRFGDDESLRHVPKLFGDRGEPLGAYAVGKTKDGGIYREFMTAEEINKVRSVSKSGSSEKAPWSEWTERMWEKTVLKRLLKRMPCSSDVQDIIEREDAEYRQEQPIDVTPALPAKATPTGLQAKLEAAKGASAPPSDEPPQDYPLPSFDDDGVVDDG